MDKPVISVIIPTRSLTTVLLEENLPSFEKQKYKQFEVIVLPNDPSDKDHDLKNKYPWLEIIPTRPILRPAQKRDVGVKASKGEIIAFIDDDAFAREDWLEKAVEIINSKEIEAVCGPGILPENSYYLEKIFDEILKTGVGSGGLSYRFIPQKERFVDDYPSMNFLIRKDVFNTIGGFDSDYWPGEDSKLCEDLVYKQNGKILYHPDIVVYHHRRVDLKGYLKQHGQYGFHRGAFFAHGDRNSKRLFYLAPTGLVIYMVLLIGYYILDSNSYYSQGLLSFLIPLPLFIYIILIVSVGISAFRHTRSLKIALLSSIVLFSMHIIYGIKFIEGFAKGLIKKEKIY